MARNFEMWSPLNDEALLEIEALEKQATEKLRKRAGEFDEFDDIDYSALDGLDCTVAHSYDRFKVLQVSEDEHRCKRLRLLLDNSEYIQVWPWSKRV